MRYRSLLSAVAPTLIAALLSAPAYAQKSNVKSATPASREQGAASLDVVIAGSGYGPGAGAVQVLLATGSVATGTTGWQPYLLTASDCCSARHWAHRQGRPR